MGMRVTNSRPDNGFTNSVRDGGGPVSCRQRRTSHPYALAREATEHSFLVLSASTDKVFEPTVWVYNPEHEQVGAMEARDLDLTLVPPVQ